jgi:hypothetical protein
LTHARPAGEVAQLVPQEPQLVAVDKSVSQPSLCLFALQSAKPLAHMPLQVPAQVRVCT